MNAVKPYKIPRSALVVIYTSKLEVLLIERADRPGYWQSVTGSQDEGEMLAQTATREVMEETGIDATQYRLSDWQNRNVYEIYAIWRHRYAPGTTHNTEHVYSLQLQERLPVTVAPREHLQYIWLPWRAAADKAFSWTNADAIRDLPRRLSAAAQ